MSNWFKDNSQSIGQPPMVRLNRITRGVQRRGLLKRVSKEGALNCARRLVREEGILSGISCGTAVAVGCHEKNQENEDKAIVVILPDFGERHLSSILFAGLINAKGLTV